MAAGKRRRARVVALQALYEADSSNHEATETLERMVTSQSIAEEPAAFARELVASVHAKREEIDRTIAELAPAWPVAQLPPVDRNVLRLAISEMLGDNRTPVSAVINEAVELAKQFGSDKSASFVNGVLGSIARQQKEPRTDQSTAGRG